MALSYGGTLASTIPTVSTTPGPTYATYVNAVLAEIRDCLQAKVTPAGFNVNANIAYGGFAPTGLGYALFNNAASAGVMPAATYPRGLYAVGSELYWNSATQQVQITLNGALNAAAIGGITGDFGGANPARVAFNDAGGRYDFTEDTNLYAKLRAADLLVGEYGLASPFFVTLKSPAALAAAYTLTLPTALPGSTALVTLTAAGVLAGSLTIAGLTSLAAAALSGTTSVTTAEADIRHAARSLNCGPEGAVVFNDGTVVDANLIGAGGSAVPYWVGAVASGLVRYRLPIAEGETLTVVKARIRDSANAVTMKVLWNNVITNAGAQLGATQTSAASSADQTLTLATTDGGGTPATLAIGANIAVFVEIQWGAANFNTQRSWGIHAESTR